MKYQALYRKYRPLTFDNVFGQDVIVKTLKNSIMNEKFSHAYLFCGPRGTGKTSIAKLFAKAVNCIDNIGGNPCEKCLSCKKINDKLTSDIVEIDAASNNGVDEIREIRNKINLVPSELKYKIYIVDEVHMLSIGAFNALLKTLEDPPAHIIFILATTEAYKIPSTIVSRCQRFDFKKIDQKIIEEKIKKIIKEEKIKIDDSAISEIARLSDGGLRDAESLLDKLISYSSDKIIESEVHMVNGTVSNAQLLDLLKKLAESKVDKVLDYINEFNDNGKDLIRLVEDMMIFLRDLLIFMLVPNYFSNDNNLNEFYRNSDIEISKEKIYELIKNLNAVNNEMRFSNNKKILLEVTLLNYCFSDSKNIEELKTEKVAENQKDEKKNSINEEEKLNAETLENLKGIRINNTLVSANKSYLNEIIKHWSELKKYTVDQLYGLAAGILVDSIPRAVGENNILVTYAYESMAERANECIEKIEEMLYKIFEKKYKFISTSEEEWEKIKTDYIKKKKNGEKYEIISEDNVKDNKNKSERKTKKNEDEIIKNAIDLFGDNIIEVK